MVLPCVPGDRDRPAAGHHRRPARRPGAAPAARARAPRPAPGWSSRIAVETTTVSASPTCAAAWPDVDVVAPSSRSSASSSESFASLPDTGDAALQHDAGDARHAGTADADEVHPAQLGRPARPRPVSPGSSTSSPRRGRSLTRPLAGCHDPVTIWARAHVGVPAAHAGRGLRHLRRPARGRRASAAGCRGSSRRSARRPRPAGRRRPATIGTALSALLAVADRAAGRTPRAARRRSARRRSSRRPAQREVGGGVGQVHPVAVGQHDVRRVARRRPRARSAFFGPDDVQHLDAGRAQRGRGGGQRPRLSDRAPCEPPKTSSVGRSESQPEVRPRLVAHGRAGRAWRSRGAAGCRRPRRAAAACRVRRPRRAR